MYHTSQILWRVFFIYLLAFLLPNGAAQAQNPATEACGLPASGSISVTVTYTLIADCTQTGRLMVPSGATLTINGGGFTIDGSALRGTSAIVQSFQTSSVDISNVTFVGGGATNSAGTQFNGAATLTNVTYRNPRTKALSLNPGTATTYTFTNILIETVVGSYFDYEGVGTAVEAIESANATFNNLVIRDHYGGNAAINAWLGGSVTLTGCFSYDRIFPQVFSASPAPRLGTITDNSTGACTGTIGNGDPAVVSVAAPQPAACGLPAGGYLQVSADYTLNMDCQQTGTLFIPVGVTVTITGNGHTINAPAGLVAVRNAGDLTINNAILAGASASTFLVGYRPEGALVVNNSVFSGNQTAVTLVDHRAVFNSVVFRDNSRSSTGAFDATAMRVFRQSVVTLRDSVFINNMGGSGAMLIGLPASHIGHAPPSLRIEDTITWEGNSPANFAGEESESYVTYGSSRPPVVRQQRQRAAVVGQNQGCETTDIIQAFPMGVVGCIFRNIDAGSNTVMSIYGVNEHSVGYHLLTVEQWQLDAASGEGIIGVSPDGRALVVMWPDRNVTVKVGPNQEGKILHLTFRGGLHGRVINTTSTYGEAPGLRYLAGGGDSQALFGDSTALEACDVTTTDILNFRATPGGEVIGLVPSNTTLAAIARSDDWLAVAFDGSQGWVSGNYLTFVGDCA